MNLEIINAIGGTNRVLEWCPSCEKIGGRFTTVGVWQAPDGTLVCFYAVCIRCAGDAALMDRIDQMQLADAMETRLLDRYPDLKHRLPPGYKPAKTSS